METIMTRSTRVLKVVLGLALLSSSGCAGVPFPSTEQAAPPALEKISGTPFFPPTVDDVTQLAKLASELDSLTVSCTAAADCADDVQFSRALMNLFENREAARASFERVAADPASPLAPTSAMWLSLLTDPALASPSDGAQQAALRNMLAQMVRTWMVRLRTKPVKEDTTRPPDTVLVQRLHRQIQNRDRVIADMRFQLEAFKRIDRDHERTLRTAVSPGAVVPATTTRP